MSEINLEQSFDPDEKPSSQNDRQIHLLQLLLLVVGFKNSLLKVTINFEIELLIC